jgi:hypothetical protein
LLSVQGINKKTDRLVYKKFPCSQIGVLELH